MLSVPDQVDLYVQKLSEVLRWSHNGSLPLEIAVLMSTLGCSFSRPNLAPVAGSERSILTIAPWIAFNTGSFIHIDSDLSRSSRRYQAGRKLTTASECK